VYAAYRAVGGISYIHELYSVLFSYPRHSSTVLTIAVAGRTFIVCVPFTSGQGNCTVHLFVAASALHCAKGKERALLDQDERLLYVVNKMSVCVVVVFVFSCSCDLIPKCIKLICS
jgi:uncharacterized membrane protein